MLNMCLNSTVNAFGFDVTHWDSNLISLANVEKVHPTTR